MKYKIGNQEIEAIQYNDKNSYSDLVKLLQLNHSLITSSIYSGWVRLETPDLDLVVRDNEYLVVVAPESTFVLSEQDFNNMVTKVKEPKFKIGDVAYIVGRKSIRKDVIFSINKNGSYLLCSKAGKYEESELFTLKEAIKELKEL